MSHVGKIILVIVAIFLAGAVVIVTGKIAYTQRLEEVKKEELKRQELYSHILEGASTSPTNVSVDYLKPTSKGSPLIFGGAQPPNSDQVKVWDMFSDVGVTSVRLDLAINYMIRNTTLEEYKANHDHIQDITKWNNFDLSRIKDQLAEAKKRGIKTIGIMDYVPPWLSHDGTDFGVPKDWEIYEDVVKKIYRYHRDNLDFVELWNEANHSHFLTVDNSGMTKKEAYEQIYYHAAKAIREVDKEINDGKVVPLGGPVDPSPNDPSLLEPILENDETRNWIDFISFHDYNSKDSSWDKYTSLLEKYKLSNLPIFITEWNYDGQNEIDKPSKTSTEAISYTANKLFEYLRKGISGANYYSLLPMKSGQYLSFYKQNNNSVEPLPQAKTWRILSKDLALGKGESSIYTTTSSIRDLNVIGFTNVNKEQGIAVVNPSSSARVVNIHFSNLSLKNFAKVQVYYASATEDATKPVYEGTVVVKNGSADFVYYLPEQAIIGLKLVQEKDWFNLL